MSYRKIKKENKFRYSIATYRQKNGDFVVDLRELAEKVSKFQYSEKLNFTKATELQLLALDYLRLRKMENKIKKEGER